MVEHQNMDAPLPVHADVLARVRERMRAVIGARERRIADIRKRGDFAPYPQYASLFARMTHDAAQPAESRGGAAFAVLSEDELRMIAGVLSNMDGNDFRAFERDDPRIPMLLDVLRAQYLAPPTTVPPAVFRDVGRRIIEILIPLIVYRFLPRGLGSAVIVLPWRAALLFGEVYRAAGTTFFWHIGAKRHEQTLATELYHESEPPLATRTLRHIICDPMLATGGTTCATIARLLAGGVKPWDIAVQSIIAAPEGAFRVTMEHPGVRIFTCALDERLDRNGYIVPGLGDFGDLAFADLDDQYVQKRWLDTGLLTRPQAELVLERTQAIRGSAHAS